MKYINWPISLIGLFLSQATSFSADPLGRVHRLSEKLILGDVPPSKPVPVRRQLLASLSLPLATAFLPNRVEAAPPIAVIAEELGYFPISQKDGDTVYVPKRVKRTSSDQAIALAKKLSEAKVTVYTAYWCPHCARQRELFGKEAWSLIQNVECAPKGYKARPTMCATKKVDGYPTWVLANGEQLPGERDLSVLAEAVGFKGFQPVLEQDVPPPIGSSTCKIR